MVWECVLASWVLVPAAVRKAVSDISDQDDILILHLHL